MFQLGWLEEFGGFVSLNLNKQKSHTINLHFIIQVCEGKFTTLVNRLLGVSRLCGMLYASALTISYLEEELKVSTNSDFIWITIISRYGHGKQTRPHYWMCVASSMPLEDFLAFSCGPWSWLLPYFAIVVSNIPLNFTINFLLRLKN